MGKGKMVLLNDPEIFDFNPDGRFLEFEDRQEKLAYLNAILAATSGRTLPSRPGLHVFESLDGDCVLANYFGNDEVAGLICHLSCSTWPSNVRPR